ncbi:MAG: hypothetical protein QNJ46_02440 [Leptolyngbyaceae cyanobacterium MO_188.B28]|nr:hypothetical protein [Leptolyngbyaceae cyanobacterium MO_188.B28]
MTEPLTPKHFSELAAGYVLGDLTPEEAEIFQQRLTNHPELTAEVTRLQETLGLMAYGLPETSPPFKLRSSILKTAAANLEVSSSPQGSNQSSRFPSFRLFTPWIASGAVALLAITLGLENHRLRQQSQTLQAQVTQQGETIARLQQGLANDTSPFVDAITLTSSSTFLTNNWQGIEQLSQDHIRSLIQPQGPVDFASNRPEEIVKQLQSHFSKPLSLARLTQEDSTLLGGSPCQFGQIQGLRLTYQVTPTNTLSLYQLERVEKNSSFPQLDSTQLYMDPSNGPSIIFWADDSFLYALVAELPAEQLKQLAAQVVFRS